MTIALNRPEVRNALRPQTYDELADAVRGADARCIVITGADPGFCSGDDVAALLAVPGAVAQIMRHKALIPAAEALQHTDVPVIAAVNGAAVGWGVELALMADLRVLSERAVFHPAFTQRGLICSTMGLSRLAQLIGREAATEAMLTGAKIDAQESLRLGLTRSVVPHDELMPAAMALAHKIAAQPPLAVAALKAGLRRALDPDLASLGHWCATELVRLLETADHQEAVAALVEKRIPQYVGR
ncbi:enoyl-CoA hydratase-related protein [Sporichthya sp.]|uniref:enoyl-CoA hydratase/isomerase family protein n=1 Tax=Sporichthya sp. TaxID=65475 RepID=UPI0025E45244|nr:enoyl-CoA hydratase-related protein [Sporichthya sp.]